MGTTTNKLSYLTETKEKLAEKIIDLGGDITEQTTFREYANELQTIYDNVDKVSAEGTDIKLQGCNKGKMQIQPIGNTTQNSTTGKNLLVYPYYSMPDTENFKFNSDGSIIINGTFTTTINIMLRVQNQSIPNGDYSAKLWGGIEGSCYFVIGGSGSNVSYSESVFRTFTVTDNDCGYFFIQIPAGKTINNVTVYPMLVSGTYTNDTMPEWEPYTGGIVSPNPNYPQTIKNVTGNNKVKISGKNQLEKNLNLGTIELCKIGNNQDYIYKDYSNNKWYKKEIIDKIESYNGETITTQYISTTGGLDTGATVYYVVNPTDIEITEQPLINQLESLNRTIIQVPTIIIETESEEDNAQLIVNASALKSSEDNEN